MTSQGQPRKRRRADRPSSAKNIDRSVDRPDDSFGTVTDWDGEREVELDGEEPAVAGDEFWRDEQPPHHG